MMPSAGGFPGPAIHDGVWNSFPARLADAVNRWDGIFAAYGVAGGMSLQTSGTEDVLVTYNNIPQQGLASWTTSPSSGCGIHGYPNNLLYTTIQIRIRDDWFTQDDSRRAFWENCVPGSSYTCQKRWDFGSTMTHELGHTLVLGDVDNVDAISERPPARTPRTAATRSIRPMCNGPYTYETCRRTPSAYDINGFVEHFANI